MISLERRKGRRSDEASDAGDAVLPPMSQGANISPGFDGRVYFPGADGTLYEITVHSD